MLALVCQSVRKIDLFYETLVYVTLGQRLTLKKVKHYSLLLMSKFKVRYILLSQSLLQRSKFNNNFPYFNFKSQYSLSFILQNILFKLIEIKVES